MSCSAGCGPVTTAQCHCAACHRTFGGLKGFDLHRSGPVERRECLDPSSLGLQRVSGVWRRVVTRAYPRDGE